MIAPKESKGLKRTYKRMLWFVCIFFVFALVISYLMVRAGIHPVLNGFIIIVCASIFYLIFLFICAKIDKKKDAKREKDEHRDPFTH